MTETTLSDQGGNGQGREPDVETEHVEDVILMPVKDINWILGANYLGTDPITIAMGYLDTLQDELYLVVHHAENECENPADLGPILTRLAERTGAVLRTLARVRAAQNGRPVAKVSS